MTTTLESHKSWFISGTTDRVGYYFENAAQKYPGTLFRYDSMGSFLLGAMVERLTGKSFLTYLQDKCLDDIGFSKDAYCLQCPDGHSWADSGLLCTSQDLWKFARFVLNKGIWNGRQYLNSEYITKATTPQIPNNPYGFTNAHNVHGYGYQFWGAPGGCFAAKGMGLQLAFFDPAHDFIMIINSDNQGNELKYEPVYRALYTHILPNLTAELPDDPEENSVLKQYISTRKLFCLYEGRTSSYVRKINGRTYICEPNAPGIRQFRLDFDNTEGSFCYINGQGEKTIRFGFGHNVFHKFPQDGYSDMIGTIPAPGNKYDAAFSADWPAENTLRIRVQIIDKYMGNLSIIFAFRDEDTVTVRMTKQAEDFLKEYSGIINAKAKWRNFHLHGIDWRGGV